VPVAGVFLPLLFLPIFSVEGVEIGEEEKSAVAVPAPDHTRVLIARLDAQIAHTSRRRRRWRAHMPSSSRASRHPSSRTLCTARSARSASTRRSVPGALLFPAAESDVSTVQDDAAGVDVCLTCFNGGCRGEGREHARAHAERTGHSFTLNIQRTHVAPTTRVRAVLLSHSQSRLTTATGRQRATTKDNEARDRTLRRARRGRGRAYRRALLGVRPRGGARGAGDGAQRRARRGRAGRADVRARGGGAGVGGGDHRVRAHAVSRAARGRADRAVRYAPLPTFVVIWLMLLQGWRTARSATSRRTSGSASRAAASAAAARSTAASPVDTGMASRTLRRPRIPSASSSAPSHLRAPQVAVSIVHSDNADGQTDIYCYLCNDARLDPELAVHLGAFGISVATQTKTEKSMTELVRPFPPLPAPHSSPAPRSKSSTT
jgi:hypothetical protein